MRTGTENRTTKIHLLPETLRCGGKDDQCNVKHGPVDKSRESRSCVLDETGAEFSVN